MIYHLGTVENWKAWYTHRWKDGHSAESKYPCLSHYFNKFQPNLLLVIHFSANLHMPYSCFKAYTKIKPNTFKYRYMLFDI